MDDLISRKALLDEMNYIFPDDDVPISPMDAKLLVEDALAVEAEPVQHGRWEYYGNGTVSAYALCSMCGSGLAKEDAAHFDYCPYCGAKMDLEAPHEQQST